MRFAIEYGQIPLDLFRGLPPETYSERFFRAGEHANRYVDARAASTLRELGAFPGAAPRGASQLASGAGVRPERLREFRWLLEKLALSGEVVLDRQGGARPGEREPEDPAPLREEILADEADLAPTLDLIDTAAEGYPAFLRGEKEGSDILFTPRALPLWERYFSNSNPVYRASNLLGAHAVGSALPAGALRVLEVGGGLGSGTEALLAVLERRAARGQSAGRVTGRVRDRDSLECYWFTELSPGFLRRGQDRLLSAFPGVPFEFRLVDMNRGLAAQGVPCGSFGLVYAVNTLHAARDLVLSLTELRSVLAPGGLLALVEGVRPSPGGLLYVEFVFGLLREFREFRRDAECRPHGGFLEWRHWRKSLERAGFEEVRCVPDLESAVRAYPRYAMAAILARNPGAPGGARGPAGAAGAVLEAAGPDAERPEEGKPEAER